MYIEKCDGILCAHVRIGSASDGAPRCTAHRGCPQKKKLFLNPEGGSQNATLVVVVVVVVISSLKIPKVFLIRSGAQRNCAYTFALTLPTSDLPSQIFHLFSN